MDRRKRTARIVALMSLFSMTDTQENVPVASFDGDGSDLVSLIVGIEPVQDLHGYENPWPAGGGKNKLPFPYYGTSGTINGITYTVNADGTILLNGTASARSVFCLSNHGTKVAPPSGSYILSKASTSNFPSLLIDAYNGNSLVKQLAISAINDSVAFTLDYDGYDRIEVFLSVSSGETVSNKLVKPMIRPSSVTDATFAPYSNICPISGWTGANIHVSPTTDAEDGTTYSITFPTSAGTVYGGTLDVTTGKLTVDRAKVLLDGVHYTLGGRAAYTNVARYWVNQTIPVKYKLANSYIIADALTPSYASVITISNNTPSGYYVWSYSNDTVYVVLPLSVASTNAEATQWLKDNPVELVYELATPIVYDLTPTEVSTLIGTNNIWADTGEIKYIEYNV